MKKHAKKCASWGRSISLCDCDSYHTFDELYDHRIALYITLCKAYQTMDSIQESFGLQKIFNVWRSKLHHDNTFFDGWFLLGIYQEKGKQITYHVPNSEWSNTEFAETLNCAPEFDGHTNDDVLARLKTL